MSSSVLPPHELVERALAAAASANPGGAAVAIAQASSSANLRWANNTLTTNGVMSGQSLTVIATDPRADGVAAGVVSREVTDLAGVESLVADAVAASRSADVAEDARDLLAGSGSADFADAPGRTGIEVFADVATSLGSGFGEAAGRGQRLYGFVEHTMKTTYLGTSTGVRRRFVQPGGYLSTTGKDGDGTNSAWYGQATTDFTDVNVSAAVTELDRRLGWGSRRIELPAGRYETVLPPTSVADLMIYAYWTSSARDAFDGRTVFSKPGGGTRVGEVLSEHPITMRSDPADPRVPCAPFVTATSSSSESSVFDNGQEAAPVTWVDRGRLNSLITTRHTAELTGLADTQAVDNLIVEVDGGDGDTASMVASTQRGLLFTSLWYIREVDPQTLLLTGLTRDGVYLIENGEITGAVNNFRFNESPVDIMSRFTQAGAAVPAFSREWGDYFPRVVAPALRIPDFNCSSVSKAS
jgi:predicted Zn-dependent protease